MAVDQCLFAPTNLLMFLSTMSVLEGSDPREKLKRTYAPTMATNWAVWPWVQAINFKLVPLEHRLLFVNVIALGEHRSSGVWGMQKVAYPLSGWNCYLSYQNSSDKA